MIFVHVFTSLNKRSIEIIIAPELICYLYNLRGLFDKLRLQRRNCDNSPKYVILGYEVASPCNVTHVHSGE